MKSLKIGIIFQGEVERANSTSESDATYHNKIPFLRTENPNNIFNFDCNKTSSIHYIELYNILKYIKYPFL